MVCGKEIHAVVEGKSYRIITDEARTALQAFLQICVSHGEALQGTETAAEKPGSRCPSLAAFVSCQPQMMMYDCENGNDVMKNCIIHRFGEKRVDQISTNDVQCWLNEMDSKGYQHTTMTGYKNALETILGKAVRDGYISDNPAASNRLVVAGKMDTNPYAIPTEIMKGIRDNIENAGDEQSILMLGFLVYTGMRLEEICNLRWEDINFEEGTIRVERIYTGGRNEEKWILKTGRAGDCRLIPLPINLKCILETRKQNGYILKNDNHPEVDSPVSRHEAYSIFRRIQDAYTLQEYDTHSFRETCALGWKQAGMPADIVAFLLGHSANIIPKDRLIPAEKQKALYNEIGMIMNGTGKHVR